MDQTGSHKLLGLESDLSATTAQNTVVLRTTGTYGYCFGRGCDRTVRRNLGLFGLGFCFGSLRSFVRLFFSFFPSFFLSFFLSLSLSWLDLQDQAARFLTTT